VRGWDRDHGGSISRKDLYTSVRENIQMNDRPIVFGLPAALWNESFQAHADVYHATSLLGVTGMYTIQADARFGR
jgi:hypothetical protein